MSTPPCHLGHSRQKQPEWGKPSSSTMTPKSASPYRDTHSSLSQGGGLSLVVLPQGTRIPSANNPGDALKPFPLLPVPPPHDTYTAEGPTEESLGCPGLQEALLSPLTPPGSDTKHRYTCSHMRTCKEQPPSRAHHTPGSPLLSRLRPYLPAFSPLPGTFCTFCSLGLTNCCSSSGP